jgi:ribosomal protein S18 acetylase RimI-like enzyme
MRTLTLRPATTEDVAGMAQRRVLSAWTGGAGAKTMRRYLAGEHHPQQARAPRAAFLAERAGSLVGFVAGHRTTRFGCDGELQWLLVAPAARGGGVGAALLAALAGGFAGEGTRRVCVNVAPENAPARRLYARHGAIELSEYWMVWPDITTARSLGAIPNESPVERSVAADEAARRPSPAAWPQPCDRAAERQR